MSLYEVLFAKKLDGGGGGGQVGITLEEFANCSKPSGEIDLTGFTLGGDYVFAYRKNITKVIGMIAALNTGTFLGCTGITVANISTSNMYGSNHFNGCTGMTTAVFKMDTSQAGGTGLFNGCTNLKTADLTVKQLRNNYFYNCNKLDTIILRNTSVTALESTSVLTNTAHFKSEGSGGTIYIPKSLYDHLGDNSSSDYKHATNWSTIDGYGTITWAKIEGSIYETKYADGTAI